MNQKDYNRISEIMHFKWTHRTTCTALADYFEKEEQEHLIIKNLEDIRIGKFSYKRFIRKQFNRKKFLKDCGVE